LRRAQTVALVLGLGVIFFVAGPLVGGGGGKEAQLEQRGGGAEGQGSEEDVRGAINWLASPQGNLVSDLALTVAAVVLIPLVLWYQEQKRWRPARQFLYARLLEKAEFLVGLLPPQRLRNVRRASYTFGTRSYGTWAFEPDFITDITNMDVAEFEWRVDELTGKPELIESFQAGFDDLLGTSAGIFLARDPELNRLINEVSAELSRFVAALEWYRTNPTSTRSPSYSDFHVDTREQACIALHLLVLAAYRLRQWLVGQADRVVPMRSP
jgi:hypothetical protein